MKKQSVCIVLGVLFSLGLGTTAAGTEKSLYDLSLEELMQISVSIATLDERPMADAPGVISVITREDIVRWNPRDITDLLNLVPGFNISIEGLNAPLIQLRGTGNRQDTALIMIDGHRLNSELFGGITYVIRDIPVEMIEKIEIIRGPGSAIYGSNAFESVINIVTVPDSFAGEKSSIFARYGSHQSGHGGISLKKDLAGFRLVASAAGEQSEGPSYNYTDRGAKSGEIDYEQEIGNLYLNVNKGPLTVLGFYNRENVGPYIGISQYLNERTDRTYDTMAFEAKYQTDISDFGNVTAKVYYNRFDYDCLWEVLPSDRVPPKGFLQDATVTDSRLGAEIVYRHTFFENHQVTIGGNLDRLRLFSSSLKQSVSDVYLMEMERIPGGWIEEDKNHCFALFFQDSFDFLSDWRIILGARFDRYTKYGNAFSPRVGIVRSLGKWGKIKLLYGQAFRAPSYYESNTNAYGGLIPNNDIDPETLSTWEAEYSYTRKSFSGSINVYYTAIEDLISTIQTPEGNSKDNKYDLDTWGVETEIRKTFFDNRHSIRLNGYCNYSEDDDDHRIKRVPNYGFNLILDNRWTDLISSNLQLRYTGRMKKNSILDSDGNRLSFSDISDTWVVNFSLIFHLGRIDLKASAYNLFNEKVEAPSPERLNADGDPMQNYPYNRRFIMAGFEYRF